MTLLLIAIFLYTLIFIVMKLFERYGVDNFSAISLNYLVAAVSGILIFNRTLDFNYEAGMWIIAIIVGIIFYGVFHLFAICSQKISITMTAMASKMSVVIPIIVTLFLFNESITILKIVGIIVIIISLYLMLKPDKQNPIKRSLLLIPISIFIFTGISDTLFKVTQVSYNINDAIMSAQFVSLVFALSFISAVVTAPFFKVKPKLFFQKKNIIAGLALGFINFLAVFFFTYSMIDFEGSLFFPIFNASVVGLTAISGMLLFKEKLSKINIIGLILAIFAIVLINL